MCVGGWWCCYRAVVVVVVAVVDAGVCVDAVNPVVFDAGNVESFVLVVVLMMLVSWLRWRMMGCGETMKLVGRGTQGVCERQCCRVCVVDGAPVSRPSVEERCGMASLLDGCCSRQTRELLPAPW